MNKSFSVISLLFLCGFIAFAQKTAEGDSLATVSGRTIWYWNNLHANRKPSAAPFVFVRLISNKDTLSVMSKEDGSFEFKNIIPGKKRMLASALNFKTTMMDLDILPGDNAFMVEVVPDYKDIAAAYVSAEVSPIEIRGDTLVYQPAAVNTMVGESALEILRQMPGVEIKDNAIYINGQRVKRAYVNGTMLFGDNPMAPLNTLMADEVTQIKSFEEASVETRLKGDTHGEKDRVIDIRTKEEFISAYDAYVQGAGGVDSAPREDGKPQLRYFAGANANFFSERFLFFLNTYSNNLGLNSNRFRVAEMPKGSLSDYHIQSDVSTGIQKYWGDRLLGSNIRLDYSYKDDRRNSFSRSLKTYLASVDSPEREVSDTLFNRSSSGTHNLTSLLTINNSKIKNLVVSTNLSVSEADNERERMEWNRIKNGDTYKIAEERTGNTRSWSGSGLVVWRNYSAEKILPSITVKIDKSPSQGEEWTIDTLASSINRRYLNVSSGNDNFSVSASSAASIRLRNTEKESSSLSVSYGVEYSNQHHTQLGLDYYDATGKLPSPMTNTVNTFDFSRQYVSHGPVLQYSTRTKQWGYMASLGVGFASHIDTERIPTLDAAPHQFVLPDVGVVFKWDEFILQYHMDSSIPSIEQLRDRLSDNDPLYLVAGNPDLRPSHTHSLTAHYAHTFPKTSSSIDVSANISTRQNAIVSKISYFTAPTLLDQYGYTALPGASLTTFENCEGNWRASGAVTFTQSIKAWKARLFLSPQVSYQQTPVYKGNNLILMRDFSPSFPSYISARLHKSLNIRLDANLRYQESSTDGAQLLSRVISPSGSLSVHWTSQNKLFLSGRYDINGSIPVFGNFPRVTTQLLGLAAGVNLLEGRLRISVSGNDILSAGSSYSISMSDDYIAQSWRPTYGRYYLLSVCYRINKRKSSTQFQGELNRGESHSFVGF